MKTKLFLSAVVLLYFVTTSHAQFRKGVKAGVAFSRFVDDIDPFAKNSKYSEDYLGFQKVYRTGFTGGVFTEYRVNTAAKIGAEILFSTMGAKYRYHNTNVILVDGDGNESKAYDTYTYATGYLQLPFYMQLDTRGFKTTNLSLYAGLAPALLVNRQRVYRYYDHEGMAAKGDQKKMNRDLENVRSVNTFPFAGIKLGSDEVFFDLRYNSTLLQVFGNAPVSEETDFNTRMNTISATLGIYL